MINTVVFDLGKVLVDFHPLEGMRKLGFSKEVITRFQNAVFSGLWEQCDARPIGNEEIRDLFKQAVPGLEKEVDILWDHITVVTDVYEYSCEWISDLKKRGYRVFILSNYGQQSFRMNSRTYPFLADVDGMVISYQVEMVKPDRGIYLCLLEKYGLKPDEAVFIDDRKKNVDGAVACGFAGIVFRSYEQAKRELENLLGKA